MAADDEFEDEENLRSDWNDEPPAVDDEPIDDQSEDSRPTAVEMSSTQDLEADASPGSGERQADSSQQAAPSSGSRQFFIGYQPNFTKVSAPQPTQAADVPQPTATEGNFVPPKTSAHRQRDFELPISPDDDEPDVADRLLPPELVNRAAPPAAASQPTGQPASESVGQPMPRVQVTVTLANARALFDEALERAATQMATKFHKIVQFELAQAEFDRKSAARAADYTLRGPA